jgi:hypothetical protein
VQALILGFALCKLLVVFGVSLLSGNYRHLVIMHRSLIQCYRILIAFYLIRQCTQRLCKYQLATTAYELVNYVVWIVQLIYTICIVVICR